MQIPTGFAVEVPAWVHAELADVPDVIESVEARMDLVHRMARRNVEEGTGGPFAAVVADLDTGRIVSVGVNLVLASGLSSAHAEVVALSLAQVAVGSWELGGADADRRQLVVNGRPCAMCFGATLWSGVRAVASSVDGHEIERLTGFDEGPVTPDWQGELARRGVEVQHGVRRQESLDLYAWYGERVAAQQSLVYNARGAGPRDLG
jgi:tRNA(Arg) A34 adenosine deaminase TadA